MDSSFATEWRPWALGNSGTPRVAAGPRVGITLIELLTVMVIIGVLAGIALPSYQGMRERAQIAAAISDISSLQQEITEFLLINDRLPSSLAEIGLGATRDPWGRPYRYADHAVTPTGSKRKDRFLVPVNTDYDLYSVGPDGVTQAPFTAGESRDDIVRANNGGFVGPVALF